MDQTDDLWAAIRAVLPETAEVAAAVAAELGESLEDVHASVLIGTVALNGQLGPESAALAAIEAELVRLQGLTGTRQNDRRFAVELLDDLLAVTRALDAGASLDLETIVAIQRASGAIAARTDRPLVVLLHRYAVTRRLIWQHCVDAMESGRLEPGRLAAFGRFLLLWNELTSLAATDGYRTAERDILARVAEARRGALHELVGVVATDAASGARLRRLAVRHGLDPDRAYRLIAIEPWPDIDPMPGRPDIGEQELEVLAGRIGHLLGSTPPGAEGIGPGIRLPAVLPLLGRIAVLARRDWAGLRRVPAVVDSIVGRTDATTESGESAWVAVGSPSVEGVGSLAGTYVDLVDATRTARRLGLRGWIPDPEQLALERLLLADGHLADATVRRELGPVLADERLGEELIRTLQAYFDAGESIAGAARRLHLATRTVAYRLERIESLLGHPLDGDHGRRLSAALLVLRLRMVD